jgi:hypothetical protein
MKNKCFLVGIISILLVFGFAFSGCENGVQEVKLVEQDRASAVSNLTATRTTDGNNVIVQWDAADNASAYRIYYQYVGTKTIYRAGSGQNDYTYQSNGTPVTNFTPDRWSDSVSMASMLSYIPSGTQIRFGVSTESDSEIIGGHATIYSGIVWSAPVQF